MNNITTETLKFNRPNGMCQDCRDSLAYAKARTIELMAQINHAIDNNYASIEILQLKKDMWRWEAFIAAFGDK